MTLVLFHRQDTVYDRDGGVLWHRTITVRPSATVLRGTVDFSSVYETGGPAGATPFGRYILTIHRGTSSRGPVLATGSFEVYED